MPNKPEKFSESEFTLKLAAMPGWKYDAAHAHIERTFVRKNFLDAVDFIRQIAPLAEARDHHPDILLSGYKNVKVMLTTHSAGCVTSNDFDLANAIDKINP